MGKLPKGIKKVSYEFVIKLVQKRGISSKLFQDDELINCYCTTKVRGKVHYLTCVNECGDCFIEEFSKFNTVIDYFTTDKPLTQLYQEDFM